MQRASGTILQQRYIPHRRVLAIGLVAAVVASPVWAAPQAPAETPAAAAVEPTRAQPKADTANNGSAKVEPAKAESEIAPADAAMSESQAIARRYCANIAGAAADARVAWQSKKLLELETRIKARIAELDAKQVELKAMLDKRDQIDKEARDRLVGIYGKMNPETAAAQISALDDEMAAAVLGALSANKASAIFNQMASSDRAAKLAGLMANPTASLNDKKL